ncbi:polyprenyl synthetase family protein [Aquimarina sp. ERC-38]|uniref:polyprenyl synthetase family protein n=1 Tax=Aquimarina sp. ERC-38 TaxID=2949996 RepID=UPI00224632FA|nr:polyprenyl synthetase family protein [Aquimarina sp. ERC-38]UZO81302.1 polyprenyl synthetase family protein [Aquimarina sp. ERC-38]
MHTLPEYHKFFSDFLKDNIQPKSPTTLYEPISYILQLGGKRLRPVLTLLTTEIFGGAYKQALPAALAIELFHNFSLIHDDIMDAAPLRRGKPTVHKKWNVNTGILSGDSMLIESYRFFEVYDSDIFLKLVSLFSKTALEVCEGQQLDMDFEDQKEVAIEDYLHMIEYKTAVLVGAAMQMGALVAGSSNQNQEAVYNFGRYLGIAFQLQDDYLDTFGDPKTFGKQVGGDIIENKKTYLYLSAIQNSTTEQKAELLHYFSTENLLSPVEKVRKVSSLYQETEADKVTRTAIENYTDKAFSILDTISISKDKKEMLYNFGRDLMDRKV